MAIRLGLEGSIKPDGYEIFNGSVIFWFEDGEAAGEVLKRLRKEGIPYEVEWDEEGAMGIVLKRER